MGKICGKEDCPLYKNSSMIFDPIKSGNNPKIMLVMDSPDLNDRTRIFQNENTNFLFNCLGKYGVSEISGPFLCATSVRCAGDMSKFSESQKTTAQKCCREYFAETVKKWKPKLILSFGAMSLTQTTKHKGIKNHQGNLEYIEEWGCHVMPCYGPGYILRNMAFEGTWASAFNTVKNFIEEGWQPSKDDGKYEIEEVQSLKGLFSEEDCKNGIAIDTETQGLDWTHPNFTCVGYSVCGGDGTKGYQIYLFEESSEEDSDYSILWERPRKTEKGFTSKKFPTLVHVKRSDNFYQKMEELRWFLENDKITKVMHNGSYDCHVFKAFFKVAGRLLNLSHDKRVINIKGYDFDTQNAAQLLDENLYAMSKLETLQKDMTDISERYDSGVFQKNFDKGDMLAVEKEALTRYAVLDTITSQRVYLHLKKELESKSNKKLERYMERFVMPTVNTLMEMEHTGAFVDVPRLEQAQHDITKLRDEEHNLAMSFIPKAVIEKHKSKGLKLSRNDLVRDTLFSEEGYKLKPEKKTKSGEPSADQDSLKLMLDKIRNKKALEFIRHFTEYKKYDTLAGRYLAGFEKFRACDGRIHSKFSICQAATGRSSAQKPNVQNIPNRGDAAPIVRRIIGAKPGYKILKADASQAELRWLSHYAQDKAMMSIFQKGIIDIHRATAMGIVNHIDPNAWDGLDDDAREYKRKIAKPVNFGYCLRKGTKIITSEGIKPIEDIEIGDMVLTHKKRWRKVIALQQPRAKTLYRITTKTGKVIECTPDHMMLVHFPSANGRPGRQGFVPASDLLQGDYLVYHNTEQDCHYHDDITKEEARIIGWYIAEGCYSRGSIHISQSREYNPEICALMDACLNPLGMKQGRDGFKFSGASAAIKSILNKGKVTYTEKSAGIDFDASYWRYCPIEIRRELIAGLWDGDGSIFLKNTSKLNIQYVSLSSSLLLSMQDILDSLGITSTIYEYPEKRTKMLHITGSYALRKFIDTIPTVKRSKGFGYAPKKQFAAEERIDSIVALRVNEIVYDFTVEEDHSFVANSLFTHNCYGMHPLSFISYAKVEYGVDVSEEEALAYHKAYFDKYWRLPEYYQEMVAYGKEYGYVESQLGRRRRLPELNSHNKGLFNQAMRQAINFPIQSSSSDTVLIAANEIQRMGLPKGDFRLIMFIHDELVAEVREDCDIDKYARIMKESIENPPLKELFGINLTVPLESKVEFGDNLNDCKKWEFSK